MENKTNKITEEVHSAWNEFGYQFSSILDVIKQMSDKNVKIVRAYDGTAKEQTVYNIVDINYSKSLADPTKADKVANIEIVVEDSKTSTEPITFQRFSGWLEKLKVMIEETDRQNVNVYFKRGRISIVQSRWYFDDDTDYLIFGLNVTTKKQLAALVAEHPELSTKQKVNKIDADAEGEEYKANVLKSLEREMKSYK